MKKLTLEHITKYKVHEVYETISDVQSYPKFVPWCSHANILNSEESYIKAELGIKFGPIRKSYTSSVILNPPKNNVASVEAKMVEGPFKYLQSEWKIKSAGLNRTLVKFTLDFAFQNALLQKLSEMTLNHNSMKILKAFEKQMQKQILNY